MPEQTPPTPLVSVIVPNYNYAASLRLCLRAILDQSYRRIELIMVDDGSTDDSVAIAESLGVTVIRTPRNLGVAGARNLGIAESSGEICFFVDSDVALAPDAVATAVRLLGDQPDVGAVCGIHDPEPLIRDSRVEEYRGLQYHYWSISSAGDISFLFPASCAVRRSVLEEVGPFNERLRNTEEVDYGNRLTQRHRLLLTPLIRSRHDHDAELVPLLRKLFKRGHARVPLYAERRKFARGFETSSRAGGSLAALASLALLPTVAFSLYGLIAVALALGVSLAADAGMYRFVARQRGWIFLGYFTAVHWLVNVAIAAGVAAGALHWLCSPAFRRLYGPPAVPQPAP
ncbi:glycosyltransferase family 2 protein [Streptomyces aidingensis]|uniref:Glycosyltransferase, GT2 family n=1 Tax=Streptomyces aidingensis TaxID=910347 RepID=A0A1I1RBC7_9ACTN|nr:glycosyltransferase family 2 protein [Streptomyces aidingensis]SFD31661.1 Glycosyltransferase, GT2 family [Streptomyces aidingensis]